MEAFQNFDEEQAVNIIANTFDNGAMLNGINYNPTFHPMDKVLQLHEEKNCFVRKNAERKKMK